jgi:hypothetical protein
MVHLEDHVRLETLWLHDTNISDAGLAHLHSLKSLQQLELMKTRVTAAGVAELQRHLPDLRVLR